MWRNNNVVLPLPLIIALAVLCSWSWVMTEDYKALEANDCSRPIHASL